jgi:acyl carrier protein
MNLTRDEIIEAVNNALVNEMELDPAEIAPEKTFFDDLGLDSIDMVDLIIGLQRKFGISLREDDEIKKVRTLGDVYDFFEHYQTPDRRQTARQAGSPLQAAPEPVGRQG